jgi:hypothetical protein
MLFRDLKEDLIHPDPNNRKYDRSKLTFYNHALPTLSADEYFR